LPSRKVSDESLGRDETNYVRLATNNVLPQVTVNFIVNYYYYHHYYHYYY